MKDQVTVLMEALRLAQFEIEKLRRRRQGVETTVDNVETILREPHVARAIEGLEPFVESPGIAAAHPAEEKV
jgi:hypothetical protein